MMRQVGPPNVSPKLIEGIIKTFPKRFPFKPRKYDSNTDRSLKKQTSLWISYLTRILEILSERSGIGSYALEHVDLLNDLGEGDDHIVMVWVGYAYMEIVKIGAYLYQIIIDEKITKTIFDFIGRLRFKHLTNFTYYSLGEANGYLGNYKASIKLCESAYYGFKVLKDHQYAYKTSYIISATYRMVSHANNNEPKALELAQDWIEVSSKHALKTNDKNQYGITLYQAGSLLFSQCKYEEALQWYVKSYAEYYKQDDNVGIIIDILTSVGLCNIELGRFSLAKRNYSRALAFWEKINSLTRLASIRQGIAYMYYCKGDFVKSRQEIEIGFSICASIKDKSNLAEYYCNLLANLLEKIDVDEGNKPLMVERRNIVIGQVEE